MTISKKSWVLGTVNAPPDNTMLHLSYFQLLLYLATWLVGIYINGFVPTPSDTGGSTVTFFLSSPVITHLVLGAASASVGFILLAFGWIYRLRRFVLFTGFSLACIAIAGTSGLSFVFEIGHVNLDSMIMATSFITAIYLSFLAMLSIGKKGMVQLRCERSLVQNLSIATLTFFYGVFVSGIYLNLYVASSVFSEPPVIAQKMLGEMITSPAALLHEIAGTLLLVLTIAFAIALFRSGQRKLAIRGLIGSLLVLYSLLVGVLDNIEPLFVPATSSILNPQNGLYHLFSSEIVPLFSAAGFLTAIIIAMTITRSFWRTASPALQPNTKS
jgi:hypothetical protein